MTSTDAEIAKVVTDALKVTLITSADVASHIWPPVLHGSND